jgi:BirA family biotin operon repressor/biotin-[acetyl-CoA-carboxylase] ligase
VQRLLRAADFQSGGRGRKKKQWRAAPGDALLFSVAIPLAAASQTLPAITLACGVALAESLSECGIAVQLKWPNDIRVEGCKLGGILTELVADRDGRHTLVVGVGINLHMDESVRHAIGQPAIALDALLDTPAPRSREQWIGLFVSAIFSASARFVQEGFDLFQPRFNQLLESRGELVDVRLRRAAIEMHADDAHARLRERERARLAEAARSAEDQREAVEARLERLTGVSTLGSGNDRIGGHVGLRL